MNNTPTCDGCGKENFRYRLECKLVDLKVVGDGENAGMFSQEFVIDWHESCQQQIINQILAKRVLTALESVDEARIKHGIQ